MAQAVHAGFFFARKHPVITENWLNDSQFLIIVSVPDEDHLTALALKAKSQDIPCALWHEPDLNNELTAVAFEPGDAARRLCSNLPLAGKQRQVTA